MDQVKILTEPNQAALEEKVNDWLYKRKVEAKEIKWKFVRDDFRDKYTAFIHYSLGSGRNVK